LSGWPCTPGFLPQTQPQTHPYPYPKPKPNLPPTIKVNALNNATATGALPPPTVGPQQGGMGDGDVRTCAQLLSHGLQCSKVVAHYGDSKDFCEHFAEIFTVMDVRDFVDIFR